MSALLLPLVLIAGSLAPVGFSGSADVYGEYDNVKGDTLVKPMPELRFDIDPTISFWSFPLSLDVLLSTQESNSRQQLDHYTLFLHPSELASGMTNPSALAQAIKGIEIGDCSPSWSPLTLSGATMRGASVELNPWYVYLAGAVGQTQRAVPVSDSTDGAYSRTLYSGKFGFGKEEGTHFYLTGLHAVDDPNSLPWNELPTPGDRSVPPDSFQAVTPEDNYVLGAEFNLNLFNNAFTLTSELTGSELTRDRRPKTADTLVRYVQDSIIDKKLPSWVPRSDTHWVMNLLNPGFSSSVGYAWKVQPVLKVLKTVLNGQLEYISPGYQSLGAPNLRNDNFKLAGGIARDFFDHSVLLSASASTEHDNLFVIQDRHTHETLDLKTQTTRFNSYDANLELSFPNLPYLQVSYDPYSEHNSTDSTFSNVISASAGYDFTIGKVSHSPGLTVSYSDSRGDTTGDYTDWDASLNYGLTFEFPLGLSASCGYSRSVTHAVADSRLSLDVTPSYTAFTVWRNSLSLGGTFIGSTRVDIRYSSSFPIGKICDATIGAAGTTYQGNDGRYYNEISLTGEIRKSW